jgi:putative acetyltransferase
MMTIFVRKIQEADNPQIEAIIKNSLKEFGVNKPGTAFYDISTTQMFQAYTGEKTAYFVAENEQGEILGGAGIFPTEGLEADTCELVKMYISASSRGTGIARPLYEACETFAREVGFQKIYLETMHELSKAVSIYEHFGFQNLESALGNTGHFSCPIWMLKTLK